VYAICRVATKKRLVEAFQSAPSTRPPPPPSQVSSRVDLRADVRMQACEREL